MPSHDQKLALSGGAAMGQGSHPQCRRFSALPLSSATIGANAHANPRIYSDTNTEYKPISDANCAPHTGTDSDTFPGAAHPNPHT
jgi:hypothetical protein